MCRAFPALPSTPSTLAIFIMIMQFYCSYYRCFDRRQQLNKCFKPPQSTFESIFHAKNQQGGNVFWSTVASHTSPCWVIPWISSSSASPCASWRTTHLKQYSFVIYMFPGIKLSSHCKISMFLCHILYHSEPDSFLTIIQKLISQKQMSTIGQEKVLPYNSCSVELFDPW